MMKRKLLLGASLFFLAAGAQAQKLEDAQKAIEQEQFAKAKGILKALVEKQPKKGINNFYLGQVYIQNEQLDSAKLAFDQGNANDPKSNINQVGLGTLDLLNGDVAAGESKINAAIAKTGKKDYLELYFAGRAFLDAPEPDYGKALNYLRQAVQKSGKKVDPLLHLAMGDAYLGSGAPSDAYVSYRNAITLNPELTKAQIQMAVIIRNTRAWQEAIDEMIKITEAKPNYAPTYRELAQTYNYWALVTATDTATYRNLNRTAVKYYKQYMDLTDYSVESRIKYADFLVFAGDYDELLIQARELSKLEDVNPKVLRYLGHSSYHKKDYTEASAAMEKFMSRIEKDRILAIDHLYYGLSLVRHSGQSGTLDSVAFEKGIQEIIASVEMESANADGLNEVGLEFFRVGKYFEASKVFEISAHTEGSRNQVTDSYYFALASYTANATRINAQLPVDEVSVNKVDKALAFVNEKAPDLPEPYLYRARNLSLLENSENPTGVANEYFFKYIDMVKGKGEEEVQKSKANLIEVYNKLTYFYFQTGDYAKVEEVIASALELSPEDAYSTQVLTYLNQLKASQSR